VGGSSIYVAMLRQSWTSSHCTVRHPGIQHGWDGDTRSVSNFFNERTVAYPYISPVSISLLAASSRSITGSDGFRSMNPLIPLIVCLHTWYITNNWKAHQVKLKHP